MRAASGLLQLAAAPADLAGMDAILLGQHAADPDTGSLLIIRHADLAALEARRRIDAAVVADIDRGMAEGPRDEGGYADIGPLAARRRQQMGAEGELGDIELAMAEGALKDFLGMARHMGDGAALDGDPPVEERPRAIISLAGQR